MFHPPCIQFLPNNCIPGEEGLRELAPLDQGGGGPGDGHFLGHLES